MGLTEVKSFRCQTANGMQQSRWERKERGELGGNKWPEVPRAGWGAGIGLRSTIWEPTFPWGIFSYLWSLCRHKWIRTHFPYPHSSCFYSRETTAILAMTSNCQRSESCASFTSQGSVLGLRTAPTCMISFAVSSILVALGCSSWGSHWAASFFCPFEPLFELSTCSPKKARRQPLPFPFLSKSKFQGQLCRPELALK